MTHAIKFLSKNEAAAIYSRGDIPAVMLSPHIQVIGRTKMSSLAYRLPTGEQGSFAFRIYAGKVQGKDPSFDSIILGFVARFGKCLVAREGGGQPTLWYNMP